MQATLCRSAFIRLTRFLFTFAGLHTACDVEGTQRRLAKKLGFSNRRKVRILHVTAKLSIIHNSTFSSGSTEKPVASKNWFILRDNGSLVFASNKSLVRGASIIVGNTRSNYPCTSIIPD